MGGMRRMVVKAGAAGALALAAAVALALPAGSVARSARMASAQPAPSIFGIDTGVYDPSHARYVKDLPMAKAMGARWVDFNGGSDLNWGTLDYEVDKARSLGLGVILSLGGYSNACSVSPRPAAIDCPPGTSDLSRYEKDLRTELLRYGSQVEYWESWVEPNHRASWAPHPDPKAYAALLEAQWMVFKSVNQDKGWNLKLLFGSPNDFSIIPGSPGGIATLQFTDQVLQALNGAQPFDGIALHPYRFPPATTGPWVADYDSIAGIAAAPGQTGPFPAEGCTRVANWCQMTWSQELSAYEQEFANHGYPQLPMWLTQFGWPGAQKANGNYYPDEQTQALDLSAAYGVLLKLPFVKAALWFNIRNYKANYPNPDPAFFANYGLRRNNFVLKAAGKLFMKLAKQYPNN